MERKDIINFLIENNSYDSYLEIGVFIPDHNFNHIKILNKDGVDPGPHIALYPPPIGNAYNMKSDEFFDQYCKPTWWNETIKTYDIIFVDGLHLFHQAHVDIENSLKVLNDGGTIVVHDCNPIDKHRTRPMEEFLKDGKAWNGTTYQAIMKLRSERDDIVIETVDTDEGCTIIRRGKSKLFSKRNEIDYDSDNIYEFFSEHRQEILNLISVEEFKNKYKVRVKHG